MSRVYFTDRDLGKQFSRLFAEAGIIVERHGDLFQPEGSDEEWLEHCGTKGRIAVSHNFVRTLPRIEAFLEGRSPPFIGKVYRATPAELAKSASAPGRVELWFPKV